MTSENKPKEERYGVTPAYLAIQKLKDRERKINADGNEAVWWFDEGETLFIHIKCAKERCQSSVTHDSDKYCYPHSRWYRPPLAYLRKLLNNPNF